MAAQRFPDELGALIGEYRPTYGMGVFFICVGAMSGIGSFLIPDIGLDYLGGIFAALGLILFACSYFSPRRLWIYENGFRQRGIIKEVDVLWPEIKSTSAMYSVSITPANLLQASFKLSSGEIVTIHMIWNKPSELRKRLDAILSKLSAVNKYARAARI